MAGHSISKDSGALINRKVLAWATYDWANSAFELSVLAVLFPLVLGNIWSSGDSGATVTARLGWITFMASTVVAIGAPILGTIADKGGYRKRFLLLLATLGAASTAALSLVGEGEWPMALTLYLFASVGSYSAKVFYDSLLIDVTEPRNYSWVSTLGFSAGYLGGAALLGLHLWMLTSPETFGFGSVTEVFRFSFVSVGIWWLVFMLPVAFFVPESRTGGVLPTGVIRAAYTELKATILRVREYRNVVIFLCAYWLYIGGVFTVIFMATNYGQRLGFADTDLVFALLIANAAGFPATLLYGALAHRYGARLGIYVALSIYVGACVWAIYMTDVWQFYVMAVIIGCVQGGAQALSRSVYAALIPQQQPGEFFGFYGMVTKFAHVIGPLMVAIAATLSDDPKWVLLSLMPLFVCGAVLLTLVRVTQREVSPN